jgi:hypothetical protein
MFQLCFNLNRIHDSVGKTLRTAGQGHMTANSHAWLDPGSIIHEQYQSNNDEILISILDNFLIGQLY